MRKAQRPHTLADGTHLSAGQWVAAPAWAVNYSAKRYCNPTQFDAFRFLDKQRVFGEGHLSFGLGRHAW